MKTFYEFYSSQTTVVRLLFEPRDIWIGVYWDKAIAVDSEWTSIYICFIPCFPIFIRRWYDK